MTDKLKETCDRALIDTLPPTLKATLDRLVARGLDRRSILELVDALAGRAGWDFARGRPMISLAVEAYLEHREAQEKEGSVMENVTVRTTDPQCVANALLLTEFQEVDERKVAAWSDDQRAEAFEWAMREHLAASDNDDVERLLMPPHVRELYLNATAGRFLDEPNPSPNQRKQ